MMRVMDNLEASYLLKIYETITPMSIHGGRIWGFATARTKKRADTLVRPFIPFITPVAPGGSPLHR